MKLKHLAQMVGIFVNCGLIIPVILSVELAIVRTSNLLFNCYNLETIHLHNYHFVQWSAKASSLIFPKASKVQECLV